MRRITKEEAITAAGGTYAALARAFGIKPQAVQQWPDGEPIPELRQYQAREMWPHLFRDCERAKAA